MSGHSGSASQLSHLQVLAVDCQATAAHPRGHLLELGWRTVGAASGTTTHALLTRLPDGVRLPPAVARITGISARMLHAGVDPRVAWRELTAHATTFGQQPAPAVAHFARFERPFLESLACGPLPIDIVCTHEIARRVLPDLPRRTLRALAGYFGRGVGTLRRSAEHVDATALVWRELVRLLEAEGVSTWAALREWLRAPVRATERRRVWPMPREVRLALPDAPGLYRLLRQGGDVLYVGKASSLRHRVNSYFRRQHGVHERLLEMLSQARGVSFEVAPSALEAALLEPDEIKRHRPPYNIALTEDEREVWFVSTDLSVRSRCRSLHCRLGPLPSAEMLDQFAALARGSPEALGRGRWAPEASIFEAGLERSRAAHPELAREALDMRARLLLLGRRLWREGRRDRNERGAGDDRVETTWTPERVQNGVERLALRAALARRGARWFTRLTDATVAWTEPGATRARLLILEHGEITARGDVEPGTSPPIPPGHARSRAERQQAFTIATLDRLRVLTTELKRLASEAAPVAVRLGPAPALDGARLAAALSRL
jgi:DNA polymerase-3 subunit epsilon